MPKQYSLEFNPLPGAGVDPKFLLEGSSQMLQENMGSAYLYSMFDHNVEEQNNDDFCDYAVDTVSTSHVNKQPRK